MNKFPHLQAEVIPVLEYSRADRISFCQADRWIAYTHAEYVLKRLSDLFEHPQTLRMPSVLIVGESNNGKSSILQRFISLHPMEMIENGDIKPSVMLVTMPSTPTESSFWSEVLLKLMVRHSERDSAEKKRRQAFEVIRNTKIKVLIIDEFNHLANAGRDAVKLLAAIKNLSTETRISILASGTNHAMHALRSDKQTETRFEPIPLPRWQLSKEYLSFIASYERMLPLPEASNLSSREMASTLYTMAGDTIGNTVKLIQKAAVHAIKNDAKKIDVKILQALDYVRPGEWSKAEKVI